MTGAPEPEPKPATWPQIVQRIKEVLPELKPTHRKIALQVLENPHGVGFSSIQALGRKIGVNEASIVRFARRIGFSGYAEFKRVVQDSIKHQLHLFGEIPMSELSAVGDERQLQRLIHYESENLKKTLAGLKLPDMLRVVKRLDQAQRIFIAGYGATKHTSQLLGYLLSYNMGRQAVPLFGAFADYVGHLNDIRAGDVLILTSFPPYSGEGLRVVQFARSKQAQVILFTDSPRCPAYPYSDEMVTCSNATLIYTNSYTGLVACFRVIMDLWMLNREGGSVDRMQQLTDLEARNDEDPPPGPE